MRRACVVGCRGTKLDPEEERLLRALRPFGVVLFKRNVETPEQLRDLTQAVRECCGSQTLVGVDQEGGTVQRLGPPYWPSYPSFRELGQGVYGDPVEAVNVVASRQALDLKASGIDINFSPVVDVINSDDAFLVDRSFGRDAESVSKLGAIYAQAMLQFGVIPVYKHCPGHGKTKTDSHKALPEVTEAYEMLLAEDCAPYRMIPKGAMVMVGHILVREIDPEHAASCSSLVIEGLIREVLNYTGVLVSDAVEMQALSGTLKDRARSMYEAGMDLVLTGSAEPHDLEALGESAPWVEGSRAERIARMSAQWDHLPGFTKQQEETIMKAYDRLHKQSTG